MTTVAAPRVEGSKCCPDCGIRIRPRSSSCRNCWLKRVSRWHCIDCGKTLRKGTTTRCIKCYKEHVKAQGKHCLDCGVFVCLCSTRCHSCEGKRRSELMKLCPPHHWLVGQNGDGRCKRCGVKIQFETAWYMAKKVKVPAKRHEARQYPPY